MKLCLIPPRGLEGRMANGTMVMALAPLVISNPEYANTVRTLSALGMRVILDNGANEGQILEPDKMADVARDVGAHEVIATDSLHNAEETIVAVKQAVRSYGLRLGDADVMAVAQADGLSSTVMSDLRRCVAEYSPITRIRTVGIPRHLVTLKHKSVRIDLANWIEETFPGRFKIHLLGTTPVWLKEVTMARRYAPHIRSVDTSLPYNYGLRGLLLDTEPREQVWRPATYFTDSHANHRSMYAIERNEVTMLHWTCAEAKSGTTASSSQL